MEAKSQHQQFLHNGSALSHNSLPQGNKKAHPTEYSQQSIQSSVLTRNTVPPPQGPPISTDILNHPEFETIQNYIQKQCVMCGSHMSYARKIAGCASFSWCVCLFLTTGFVGFWVPFCLGRCYDIEIVCIECGYIKASLEANCL